MPSLSRLLHRKESEGDKEGWKPQKSPTSPKSSKSPKSPKSPSFIKTERNPDHLNQCAGCSNVEILIRQNIERQKNDSERIPTAILHNSFEELDGCARNCEICRLFRQALFLQELTFDGADEIQRSSGIVFISWEETTDVHSAAGFYLKVQIKGHEKPFGVVNCSPRNEVEHLALRSNVLDPDVMGQARAWLDACKKDHVGQCANLKWSSESPRFLVEILDPSRLRLRENQTGEYAALSYCWGDTPDLPIEEKEDIKRGKTTEEFNLAQRREGFSTDDLPGTIRDAIRMIHAMGVRYAWIDSLCIIQDNPTDLETMHKVYSNAVFTLCSVATTKATARLVKNREAWSQRTEPCRLGGQWLTTPDISLSELRLRSPLSSRAWTLQEERLSVRMLYVSSERIHWSCAEGQKMEMKPMYGRQTTVQHRPVYAASDRATQIPLAQDFLLACRSGTSDLHRYWTDIVRSYAKRDMAQLKDRLTALSGVAARYLSASSGDEYLAGLWANNLSEGLAWRMARAVEMDQNARDWPSWSWAVAPLQTDIETDADSARSKFFERVVDSGERSEETGNPANDAILKGQSVRSIHVTGRVRQFWKPSSQLVDWSTVCKPVGDAERYTFESNPELDMHAPDLHTGRVLVYEERKKEVIGQLDFRLHVVRVQAKQMAVWALELGLSTMLLFERRGEVSRRVGVAWNVRENFFSSAKVETIVLR